jgi:hypothetical protein
MARCVRVVTSSAIDGSKAPPLHFDVVIDSSGNIEGKRAIFGFQGEINRRHGRSMPFLIRSDGIVDFGEEYNESINQLWKTNLRDENS